MYKAEENTYWSAEELIPKTDPRLALRGALDSLQASLLYLQVCCREADNAALLASLVDLYALLDLLIKGKPSIEHLRAYPIANTKLDDYRALSHEAFSTLVLPAPLYAMSLLRAQLNLLRTHAREAELLCAHVLAMHPCEEHRATLFALNRLSSCLYLLFCQLDEDV